MDAAEKIAPEVGTAAACRAMGVSRATLYRRRNPLWQPQAGDHAQRRQPRALDEAQRQEVLDLLHSDRFADKAPAAVYRTLLDQGTYHCSIRTMYRILHENDEVRERRNQLRHPRYQKPQLLATGANQVWSWDITKLLGPAKWTYYYLYVILDIDSRYAVGWMLASRESADLAQRLIRETIAKQNVDADGLTIHSDRGPSMKSHSVAQLLAALGVTKSPSRPHVSNDNPFSAGPVQDVEVPAGVPGSLRRLRRRPLVLPSLLRVVQRGALPLGHRSLDAGPVALRTGRRGYPVAAAGLSVSLHSPSGAICAWSSRATGVADGRLDQSAERGFNRPCGA